MPSTKKEFQGYLDRINDLMKLPRKSHSSIGLDHYNPGDRRDTMHLFQYGHDNMGYHMPFQTSRMAAAEMRGYLKGIVCGLSMRTDEDGTVFTDWHPENDDNEILPKIGHPWAV
jgi:hypothetical protein